MWKLNEFFKTKVCNITLFGNTVWNVVWNKIESTDIVYKQR